MKNLWFRQSPPNKNLYNGGSEWQNDTKAVNAGVPDYYQTFYRNYDPAIARFVSVDPEAEGAESIGDYHYAGDNPIVYNDVMGDMVNVKTNQPILQGEINDPAIENDGGGYVDPAGSIGTNSDPNWMNDGAFGNGGSTGQYASFWNALVSGALDLIQAMNVSNPEGIEFTNPNALLALGNMEGTYLLDFVSNGGIVATPVGDDSDSGAGGSTGGSSASTGAGLGSGVGGGPYVGNGTPPSFLSPPISNGLDQAAANSANRGDGRNSEIQ